MRSRLRTIAVVAILLVLAVLGLALVVVPQNFLTPFVLHTEENIALTYTVAAWDRWVILAFAAVGGWLYARTWRRGAGMLFRVAGAVPLLVLGATAVLADVRLVEWSMFEPISTIEFVGLEAADHVAEQQLVMGVEVDDQARAYPVTMVAYYHIINDRLAGEPYVVTY